MRTMILLVAVLSVATGACGSGKGGDDDRPSSTTTDTTAGGDSDIERFTLACMAHSNLERPICECTGRKADADMTDQGLELLTVILEKNESRANELRANMEAQEILLAGMFMTSGPAQCAAEGAGLTQ